MNTTTNTCSELRSSIGRDQSHGCAARVAPVKRTTVRSCSTLGVCQGRTPACSDCLPRPFAPFAPGVIDAHKRPLVTREHRRELARLLVMSLALVAASAALGLLVGYLVGAA